MLSFDIRSLESQAVVVDEELSADDAIWQEGDPKPAGSVHVTGRLSSAGPGRFYWHGRIEGNVALECSRCLAPYEFQEDEVFSLVLYPRAGAPSDEVELASKDLDVLYFSDPVVPLAPIAEERVQMALPMKPLCKTDCLGLCPMCGMDRNLTACACAPDTIDPRWEALKALKEKV